MKTINSRRDIRQYISEQAENVDCTQYGMSYEDLVNLATDNFAVYLDDLEKKGDWEYGQEMPEIEDKIFFAFFE